MSLVLDATAAVVLLVSALGAFLCACVLLDALLTWASAFHARGMARLHPDRTGRPAVTADDVHEHLHWTDEAGWSA